MSALRLLLNLIWVIAGGIWMAAAWLVAAVVQAATIIGLPWARSALTIALYTLLPFDYRMVSRDALTGRQEVTQRRWKRPTPVVPLSPWHVRTMRSRAPDDVCYCS